MDITGQYVLIYPHVLLYTNPILSLTRLSSLISPYSIGPYRNPSITFSSGKINTTDESSKQDFVFSVFLGDSTLFIYIHVVASTVSEKPTHYRNVLVLLTLVPVPILRLHKL